MIKNLAPNLNLIGAVMLEYTYYFLNDFNVLVNFEQKHKDSLYYYFITIKMTEALYGTTPTRKSST